MISRLLDRLYYAWTLRRLRRENEAMARRALAMLREIQPEIIVIEIVEKENITEKESTNEDNTPCEDNRNHDHYSSVRPGRCGSRATEVRHPGESGEYAFYTRVLPSHPVICPDRAVLPADRRHLPARPVRVDRDT